MIGKYRFPQNSQASGLTHLIFFSFTHETGWTMESSSGEVIAAASPGDYNAEDRYSVVNETVNLAVGEVYTFTLLDSLGDGREF